jgi:xanthine dehydrogenase accessory factor
MQAIATCHQQHQPCVLVTVVATEGSVPRETGTKMVVATERCYGTIGGGRLEYQVIAKARDCLTRGGQQPVCQQERVVLGTELGQCCGGVVTLLLECLPPNGFNIVLFGAGHVGQALVRVLMNLSCQLHWIDSRPEAFPDWLEDSAVTGVSTYLLEDPAELVAAMPPASDYLIMTHDHALDLALCEQVLRRDDVHFVGLIGSATKAARFRHRLLQAGISPEQLERLVCPVGMPEIRSKQPGAIAVAIAAQLLSLREVHA